MLVKSVLIEKMEIKMKNELTNEEKKLVEIKKYWLKITPEGFHS